VGSSLLGSSTPASGFQAFTPTATASKNTASGSRRYSNTTGQGQHRYGVVRAFGPTRAVPLIPPRGSTRFVNNETGNDNTASGVYALPATFTGDDNTASGFGRLPPTRRGTKTPLRVPNRFSRTRPVTTHATGYTRFLTTTATTTPPRGSAPFITTRPVAKNTHRNERALQQHDRPSYNNRLSGMNAL